MRAFDGFHALDLRPPAREVSRVADRPPDGVRRRVEDPVAAHLRHPRRTLPGFVGNQRADLVRRERRAPPSCVSSIRNRQPATCAPAVSTSRQSAPAVPPVASRSSWTSTRCPGRPRRRAARARRCRTRARTRPAPCRAGSLPGLRASAKPQPSSRAIAGPSRKPRASAPITTSGAHGRASSASAAIAASSASASASSGVMSRKRIPGSGSPGSRARARAAARRVRPRAHGRGGASLTRAACAGRARAAGA